MESVRDNVLRVRERITAAMERSGRTGQGVTIVAVTKTWGPEMVDALVEAGVGDIGENRVQEYLAKRERVTKPCRWHLVGHLQRNKATKVIGQFHCLQSLDSVRLAETLSRLGEERGVRTRALLQVNTSLEASKHGFPEAEATEAAAVIAGLPAIDLEGLMTIGPITMDPKETRGCFRRLRRLREQIGGALDRPLTELSMGMSGDFEAAVEEGATIVRLGTVLTGARDRPARAG
jgi:pyridoxal phosphate enzyme (YggS family)